MAMMTNDGDDDDDVDDDDEEKEAEEEWEEEEEYGHNIIEYPKMAICNVYVWLRLKNKITVNPAIKAMNNVHCLWWWTLEPLIWSQNEV